MRYGSVCSGIEAASVAWHPLGWRAAFFSEKEPFPCAVLAHHYPTVSNHGDMTKFKEWPDAAIDVLVGGTPCQSFSVAGLRAGLDDPRGNLMLTFGAVAARYRPEWIVWENVPGVLSSNDGRDFGSFLWLLGQLGYGFAYRVLDAQFVRVDGLERAVPQRRRRVFVVGCLGDWRRAAAVLFERESLRGNPAPRREAGQSVAPTIAGCSNGGGANGPGRDVDSVESLIPERARALTTSNQRIDAETETLLVTHALTGEGFDASEDGTGRGTPLVPTYTLAIRGRGDSHELEFRTDGTANALLTPNGGRAGIGVGAVAFDTTQITSPDNRANPQPGDPCHTLQRGAHAPAIAFDCKASGRNGFGVGEIASTQRAMGHADSHTNGGGHQAVMTSMQVRRLTPRECARLQGFQDDYLDITFRGKPASDSAKYKALGNSMAVNCMRWIGTRIQMVEAIEKARAAA